MTEHFLAAVDYFLGDATLFRNEKKEIQDSTSEKIHKRFHIFVLRDDSLHNLFGGPLLFLDERLSYFILLE